MSCFLLSSDPLGHALSLCASVEEDDQVDVRLLQTAHKLSEETDHTIPLTAARPIWYIFQHKTTSSSFHRYSRIQLDQPSWNRTIGRSGTNPWHINPLVWYLNIFLTVEELILRYILIQIFISEFIGHLFVKELPDLLEFLGQNRGWFSTLYPLVFSVPALSGLFLKVKTACFTGLQIS